MPLSVKRGFWTTMVKFETSVPFWYWGSRWLLCCIKCQFCFLCLLIFFLMDFPTLFNLDVDLRVFFLILESHLLGDLGFIDGFYLSFGTEHLAPIVCCDLIDWPHQCLWAFKTWRGGGKGAVCVWSVSRGIDRQFTWSNKELYVVTQMLKFVWTMCVCVCVHMR